MPTCPECAASYPGSGGGHCRGGRYGGCCRTFTSDSSFDAHRIGRHGVDRGCLDVSADDKWRCAPRGWTNNPPMPLAALAAKRGATKSPVGYPTTPEDSEASEERA